MVLVSEKSFAKLDGGVLVAEASDLRWGPGFWPDLVIVDSGPAGSRLFVRATHGRAGAIVCYRPFRGGPGELRVFND